MKRKVIFSIVAVALFGVAIAFSLNQEHDKESELLVKNVEALAEGDGGDEDEECPGGECSNWFCSVCCGEGNTAECTLTQCECE